MAKTSKPTSNNPIGSEKASTDPKVINYSPKGIIKEGYQPTNTVDTSNPPKQNTSEKKE